MIDGKICDLCERSHRLVFVILSRLYLQLHQGVGAASKRDASAASESGHNRMPPPPPKFMPPPQAPKSALPPPKSPPSSLNQSEQDGMQFCITSMSIMTTRCFFSCVYFHFVFNDSKQGFL